MKRKGFCEALSLQQELPQAEGRGFNLSGVIRKPHVPSSKAYILYALFTLIILTRLTISTLYLLPKKTKTLWVDITQLEPLSLLFPLHRFFFFVFFLSFYLNSWYARGRKCVVIILWCAAPSLCSGYYKGTGREAGRAMLCYAVLRYAMHAQCGENAGIMAISIQRRAKQGPGLNVHNLSSH